MVSQLKRFGLIAIAVCTLWFSLHQNDILRQRNFQWPQLLAQDSPVNQPEPTATFPTVTSTPTETGTPTPTLTPTATLTPTVTPTPGNIAQIEFPSHGTVMFGFVTIRGTALINQYRKYDIHISHSGSEDWQWLTTSYDIVRGGDLYTFDTTDYPDGYYDIRLRAIQDGGGFNETFCRRIEIRNKFPPTPTTVFNPEGTPLYSPLASPLATPAPTPDIRVRIPGGQGFYGPEEGSRIRGYTPIKATVNNLGFNFFDRFELYISAAGMEEWNQFDHGTTQHWQETISVLDTSLYGNGFYDIRLRVVYEDSNYSEYHLRRLRIANRSGSSHGNSASHLAKRNGIHQPFTGQQVNGVVNFTGTVLDPNFLRWELYWSPSGEDAWTFLVQDDAPVVNDILARLDLSQLPTGQYDFRLRIVKTDYNYDEYFVHRVHLTDW